MPPTARPKATGGPVRVVVDARLRSGESGGVESVVIGLASGLSSLVDGDDEYLFLTLEGEDDWIRTHLAGPSRAVPIVRQPSILRRGAAAAPALAVAWRRISRRRIGGPPRSDGTVERLGADVVHFTSQSGFLTSIPSIYHPHDLQHLHLPEFFTSEQRAWRERWYRALCDRASMVAVASRWTKADVQAQYNLPDDKVRVVPWAPPTLAYDAPAQDAHEELLRRVGAPPSYVLYPAQTWPHKNHVGLLRALGLLRDRYGLAVPLVASGKQNEHFPVIRREVERLDLGNQVTWTGFVSSETLVALYAAARAVVIPTRFEAASAPVWEAFVAGVPVACSNVTSLPEQAGDAALLFDPDDVEGMATAIKRLWTDDVLRRELTERARVRVAAYGWSDTARRFRAHYRRLAGRRMSDEDAALVEADSPI